MVAEKSKISGIKKVQKSSKRKMHINLESERCCKPGLREVHRKLAVRREQFKEMQNYMYVFVQ
jgi:hypothetical protein